MSRAEFGAQQGAQRWPFQAAADIVDQVEGGGRVLVEQKADFRRVVRPGAQAETQVAVPVALREHGAEGAIGRERIDLLRLVGQRRRRGHVDQQRPLPIAGQDHGRERVHRRFPAFDAAVAGVHHRHAVARHRAADLPVAALRVIDHQHALFQAFGEDLVADERPDAHGQLLFLRPRPPAALAGASGGGSYRCSRLWAMASDLSARHFSRTRSGQ